MNSFELQAPKLLLNELSIDTRKISTESLESLFSGSKLEATFKMYAELIEAAQEVVQQGIDTEERKSWVWEPAFRGDAYGFISYFEDEAVDHPNALTSYHTGLIEGILMWLRLRVVVEFDSCDFPEVTDEAICEDIFSIFV